jgi:hypothetical protein
MILTVFYVFQKENLSGSRRCNKYLYSHILIHFYRLEAADILDHPWIIKMTTEEINGNIEIQTPSSNPICSRVVENVPMSPNMIRKALSTHLWSPTMSQNRPVVRAAAKMRRQSSVVEFCLQHEDYLSRCEY